MAQPASAMDGDWTGRAAVVTGGARGIGAAVVLLLLRAGARVHVLDCLSADDPAWRLLRAQAEGAAGTLAVHDADVANPDAWDALAQALKAEGSALMALVNNAGITGPRNTVTKTLLADCPNNAPFGFGLGPSGPAFHALWRDPVKTVLAWPRG